MEGDETAEVTARRSRNQNTDTRPQTEKQTTEDTES
jgi:hypothetical protein